MYRLFFLMCCSIIGVNSAIMAQSVTLSAQDFNACSLNGGWYTYIETGSHDWQIGAHYTGTIDGSCMAYFDDDAIGQNADPSRLMLVSPTFDATQKATITLDFDLSYRFFQNDYFAIVVFDGNDYQIVDFFTQSNVGGESMSEFEHLTYDLSVYRNPDMHVVFLYDDTSTWNWWVGIDNIVVRGEGEINDKCSKALSVPLNSSCINSNNTNAWFEGTQPSCVDSSRYAVWYKFISPSSSSAVKIVSQTNFNEVLTLYSGNCNNLTTIACTNKDEHGFGGETLITPPLAANTTYFVRVSGVVGGFGSSAGDVCLSVGTNTSTESSPNNDFCANATLLTLGANCTLGDNRAALSENPIPTTNNRARASVWYRFVAPASGKVLLATQANFADNIAVFSGSCSNLTEIAHNDYGQELLLRNLISGQTYFVQISGYFATIEGDLCVHLSVPPAEPNNTVCTNAPILQIDAACTSGSNIGAIFGEVLSDLSLPFPAAGYAGTTRGKATFLRPNEGITCNLSNVTTYYDVIPFQVSQNGNYTITNSYSDNYDGYLQIYANSFDPLNPCTTYINGDDDFGTIAQSQLVLNLQANIRYYMVVSAYNTYESGDYLTSIAGNGTVTRYLLQTNIGSMATTCDLLPAAPIWYQFIAPTSGEVAVEVTADFVYNISLYEGACGELTERTCVSDASMCGTQTIFTDLQPNTTYFIQLSSANMPFGHDEGEVCVQIRSTTAPIKAKIKAFLQGAYLSANTMNTALRTANLLPKQQPFNQAPWNYVGKECVTELPQNMVDWVLVELRHAIDPTIVVERKAAFLLNNGNIVSEGSDGVLFDNAINNGTYYVVVRARNHLAIMSSVAVPLPNNNTYNFAQGNTYVMGGNAQMVSMGNNIFALKAGDIDGNGVMTVDDYNQYVAQSSLLNSYTTADCSLDGHVTVQDFNLYRPNASVIGVTFVRY